MQPVLETPRLAEPVAGIRMSPRDWGWVVLAAGFAVALRLPFVADPLEPDEGGYFLVAQQWHLGDHALYGHYWVDRPPLLLLFFKAAGLLGGPIGVRVLGCVLAVLLVAAAAVAGRAVAGPRAPRWCAVVAACLGSSYAIGGYAVDGELVAGTLVMCSCAATLWAVRTPRHRPALAAVAGATGAAAVFVKQNFVDALVFAVVLLVLQALRRYDGRRAVARMLVAGLAGVAATVGAVAGWAVLLGPGLRPLLYAMYGFRFDSAETIAAGDMSRPDQRLLLMAAMALASGMLFFLAWTLRTLPSGLRRWDPVSWAFLAMLGTGLVGIAGGGSYWLHYLIQLVPVTVLGAALCARERPRTAVMRRLVGFAVVSACVAGVVGYSVGAVNGEPEASVVSTGRWLQASSTGQDTALVTYGHPNVLLEAGLQSPYPYLWSLPTRVRDPGLTRLAATLNGPDAPTWIVEWNDFDSWHLDGSGLLRTAVENNYHLARTVCGHDIYLRDVRTRTLADLEPSCGEF